MIRVTVELVPRMGSKRTLAVAEIGQVGKGRLLDYEALIQTETGAVHTVKIERYPRWSASIWDLVARSIAKALTGAERLPKRPQPLAVSIHSDDGDPYVRISEIPEPARSAFEKNMRDETRPFIKGERECAYAEDWEDFLAGRR